MSIQHLLVVLLIVVLIFGTSRLRNIGKDIGGAVKGFKDGMREGSEDKPAEPSTPVGQTIEGEVKRDKV